MNTMHRGLGLLGLAVVSLVAFSCDDDDHDAPPIAIMGVTSIEPLLFVAYRPVPFTIRGTGFPVGASPLITFQAAAGTPFGNGTSAAAQVPGVVISDTEIRGASPVTGISGSWQCTVQVTAAGASVTSTAPLAAFAGMMLFDMDQESVLASRETPFEVFGFNFLPVSGTATVRFTSTVFGAFPGGSSTLDVQATVASRTRITGVTPAFAVAAPVPAFVTVRLDLEPNALPVTSSEVVVTFLPPPLVPVAVTSITSPLPIGIATPFTITGSGFVGGGANVEVTFAATAGTPLFGGTAAVTTVLATATSDTTITGTSPTGTSATDVTAFVMVTRTDGVSGRSATPIALFTAPVETVGAFAPTLLPVDVGTAFTITGTNLPAPQTATVRFRALEGTPFTGGTTDTVDVTASITSATRIDGTSPLATATAEFLAEVTVVLQNTIALPMGVACVFVPPGPPPPSLVVTSLNDSGAGSLRDTILSAPAGSIVSFAPLLAGTIVTVSTIVVPRSMRILAPPVAPSTAIAVDAQLGDFPVFTIQSAATATIVDQLAIAGSRHRGDGGAFVVQGGLRLNRCLLAGNEAGGRGGAVFVGISATFAATECTLFGNTSQASGGAVFLSPGVTAQVSASSFSECWALSNGGALEIGANAVLSVVNCTFYANVAVGGTGGAANVQSAATLNLQHCTLAFNRNGVSLLGTLNATNCIFRNWSSEILTEGANSTTFSLLRDGTGSGLTNGVNGNQVGTSGNKIDPQLGVFQLNGGPTRTMALKPNSPALHVGTASTVLKDQRGVPRALGPAPDKGAFEATVIL